MGDLVVCTRGRRWCLTDLLWQIASANHTDNPSLPHHAASIVVITKWLRYGIEMQISAVSREMYKQVKAWKASLLSFRLRNVSLAWEGLCQHW